MSEKEKQKNLLPHHEQLPLCTTRLGYRQGRKLTAVKVYTIASESNHLLIFGVPSLNLRREAKDLLMRFGNLQQFHVTTDYPAEDFTETYHACFERIQSARIAKKMLDTTNFYGGSLHICYAPELETVQETRAKLLQRKKDVLFRLKNLQKEASKLSNDVKNEVGNNLNVNNEVGYNYNEKNEVGYNYTENNEVGNNMNVNSEDSISKSKIYEIVNEAQSYNVNVNERKKLNMGENNVIYVNKTKRKLNKKDKSGKRLRPSFEIKDKSESNEGSIIENGSDIVDCTSVEKTIVSNINEALNYSKFGNEVIKKIDLKPMNKIVFNLNKKT